MSRVSDIHKWARDLKLQYGLEGSPIYRFGKKLERYSIQVQVGKLKAESIYSTVVQPVYGVIGHHARPVLHFRGFDLDVKTSGSVTVKHWMRSRYDKNRIVKNLDLVSPDYLSPFGYYSSTQAVNIYIYPKWSSADALVIWTSDWRTPYIDVYVKWEGESEEHIVKAYLEGLYECYYWGGVAVDLLAKKGVATLLHSNTGSLKGSSAYWTDEGGTKWTYKSFEAFESSLWSNIGIDPSRFYSVDYLKNKVKSRVEYIRVRIPPGSGIQIPAITLLDRTLEIEPITGVVGYTSYKVKNTFYPGGPPFRQLKKSLSYALPLLSSVEVSYGIDQSGQANISYSILGLGKCLGDKSFVDLLKKGDFIPKIDDYIEIFIETDEVRVPLFKGLVDSVKVKGTGEVELEARDLTKLLMTTICHPLSLEGYNQPLIYKNTHYSVIVRDMFHIAGIEPFFIGQLPYEARCETLDLQGQTPFDGIRQCSDETGFVYWTDQFCFYWAYVNVDSQYAKFYVPRINLDPSFVENDVYRTHLQVVGKNETVTFELSFPRFSPIIPRPLHYAHPLLENRVQLATVAKAVKNIIALELTDTQVEIPGGNPFISPVNILVCFDNLEVLVTRVSHKYSAETGEFTTTCEGISLSEDYKAMMRPDPDVYATGRYQPHYQDGDLPIKPWSG